MRLEELEEWVQQMRRLGEADIPYLEVDGRMLTPNQILEEARKGSDIFKEVAKQMNPHTKVSWELLEKRIETRAKEGRVPTVHKMGRTITPEEQVKEVKQRTVEGYRNLIAEAELWQEMEERRKRQPAKE